MSLERRLRRLEQALPLPHWPSEIEAAKQRCLAWLKVRIGEALGKMEHPYVVAAQSLLIDNSPAQAEQDRATLQRYAAQHPELLRGSEGARERINAKLEEMHQRLEVSHEP
jgi:hypothetical protein